MAVQRPLTPGARRVLDAASHLFYERGIHAVGVDLVAAESGVTKRTLYDRFGSKDALVAEYLQDRDERWRHAVEARRGESDDPAERVLAPFTVLQEWVTTNPRGCAFVNAFSELPDADHPARAVIRADKQWLRELLRAELAAAGADDPDGAALVLLLLHEGALAASGAGEVPEAAAAALEAARGVRDRALGRAVSPRDAGQGSGAPPTLTR